jgi:hypothetical protein
MHATAYLAITYLKTGLIIAEAQVKGVFKCSSVRRLRHLDLVIFLSDKASSHSLIQKRCQTKSCWWYWSGKYVHFGRVKKVAAMDSATGHDGPNNWPRRTQQLAGMAPTTGHGGTNNWSRMTQQLAGMAPTTGHERPNNWLGWPQQLAAMDPTTCRDELNNWPRWAQQLAAMGPASA